MLTAQNPVAQKLRVSQMAETLIGSEIIKLAAEVGDMIKQGAHIYNYTIGDFDPKVFPIPAEFTEEIIKAYREGHTNYPAASGITELRLEVASFLQKRQGLTYKADEILIAGGARPIIYAVYQTLLDKGDKVVFPVPSWNNNHYCHLSGATPIMIEATPENYFMPTAEDIRPALKGATLLALCSPLNPTGTTFTKEGLEEICDLVIAENASRGADEKPLYIMYDQIYWVLTYGNRKHFDPVSLRPELRNYTIYIDGLSKSFAATGVRVGWAFGPQEVIDKMKSILSHVGAWAPKAEQVASARFLKNETAVNRYLEGFKQAVDARLEAFYKGFIELKSAGHNVDAIAPQAAIYLTIKINLVGKTTPDGHILQTNKEVADYVLKNAHLAVVPFNAFGASSNSPWYRLSVGTCTLEEASEAIGNLKALLNHLR